VRPSPPYSLLLWLATTLLAEVGSAAPPPPLPAVPSAAQVLAQDGTGHPNTWGQHEGWVAPAWYRLTIPDSERPTAAASLNRALAALPHVFLTVSEADLFGAERGIYTHPMESGDAWERPVRVSYTGDPAGPGFQMEAGVRIQGGWNRRPEESPKHSFRVVFRARYGAGKLRHPVFGSGPQVFDQFILRAGNNHSWLHWDGNERRQSDYLRDPWMRASHAALGHRAARSRPVHLHLNGLYWGLYDLSERPDAHFAAQAWGGKPTDYDARNADKVIEGDAQAWDRLLARLNAGIRTPEDYAAIQRDLDVPAFIDFMLLNLYGANGDWDRASNWYAARRRQPAGPWRFLVWDGERTLEGVDDNRLNDDDDQSPTRIFRQLRAWPEFRSAFARRARVVLSPEGVLGPRQAAARYQELVTRLEPAVFGEAARWGDYRRSVHPYKQGPFETYTVSGHWRPEVNRLLQEYFPRRTASFIRQLQAAGLWDEAEPVQKP
jgi:hypothetical protein